MQCDPGAVTQQHCGSAQDCTGQLTDYSTGPVSSLDFNRPRRRVYSMLLASHTQPAAHKQTCVCLLSVAALPPQVSQALLTCSPSGLPTCHSSSWLRPSRQHGAGRPSTQQQYWHQEPLQPAQLQVRKLLLVLVLLLLKQQGLSTTAHLRDLTSISSSSRRRPHLIAAQGAKQQQQPSRSRLCNSKWVSMRLMRAAAAAVTPRTKMTVSPTKPRRLHHLPADMHEDRAQHPLVSLLMLKKSTAVCTDILEQGGNTQTCRQIFSGKARQEPVGCCWRTLLSPQFQELNPK